MESVKSYELVLHAESSWFVLDLESIWQYRDLLLLLVWRDFVAKYKQTILGPLWFILQPLLMTIVFTIVFARIAGVSTAGVPPMLFYLCNQLGWNYFAQNFSSISIALVANAGLFSKVYFPRLIVPLAAVVSNLLALAIQLATFAAAFVWFKTGSSADTFHLTRYVAFLPLIILQTALLGLGFGLVVAASTAKYRDLVHVTSLVTQLWMYATPVIYPLAQVPAGWQWIAALNPVTVIVESFRLMLLGTGTVALAYVATSLSVTAFILVVGVVMFNKVEKTFVDIA
jgi:homopolymeric O-antigen transport system permease protein